jgi:hypothetical protein
MVGPDVGVEARPWPGQFTEQPDVDEQPKIPVDRPVGARRAPPFQPATPG